MIWLRSAIFLAPSCVTPRRSIKAITPIIGSTFNIMREFHMSALVEVIDGIALLEVAAKIPKLVRPR